MHREELIRLAKQYANADFKFNRLNNKQKKDFENYKSQANFNLSVKWSKEMMINLKQSILNKLFTTEYIGCKGKGRTINSKLEYEIYAKDNPSDTLITVYFVLGDDNTILRIEVAEHYTNELLIYNSLEDLLSDKYLSEIINDKSEVL